MARRITMPQLGESVAEGTVGRWLKAPGDRIERDEPLVEVVTDKVTAEVPSPVAGVLRSITISEGTTVKVGEEIGVVDEVGTGEPVAPTGEEPRAPSGGTPAPEPPRLRDVLAETPSDDGAARPTSPAVRRLAQEYKVDLSKVAGSGLGGRVTKEDVLRFLASREEHTARRTPALDGGPAPTQPSGWSLSAGLEEALPISTMRRSIAEHMVRSVQTTPHAWLMVEVDVTSLVRWRESIKEEFRRREGVDLSYVAFALKATVESLKEHPILNSSWAEDRIVLKKQINVGVAVAIPDGLIVPVVKRADERSIAGLARELADLIRRAREGRLAVEDVQGGTFTLNNTGAFGSIASQPIVNQPQAAILNVEAIVKRPVVVSTESGDAIAIRSMLNLCLSFDHRVLDGYAAGSFLQSVKRRLEGFGPDTPLF